MTSVWGDWHTDAFLSLNLPSLLAPRNFPALKAMHDLSFVLFTTDRDRARISASPIFKRLADVISVSYERIADYEIRDAVATQQRVWWKAIEHVNRLRTQLFFLPPDVVWSSASMEHIGAAMAAGRRIVIVPWTIRVVAETFRPAILKYLKDRAVEGAVPSRDLVKMTLEHLHPLIAAYKRDSLAFPRHPEMLIEGVRGQGILLRLLASIPTVYRPSSVPLNENKLVVSPVTDADLYIPGDSDEVFVASLAPLGKDFTFFDTPRHADPGAIGQWWLGYPSTTNDALVRTNYRVHAADLDERAWRATEHAFDHFLRRCVIAREGFGVWQAVRRRADSSIAVDALAGALHSGALARAVRGRGRRLVLLPSDRAMAAAMSPTELDTLFSSKGKRKLVDFLRAHIVRLDNPSAADILAEGKGEALLAADDGSQVLLQRNAEGVLLLDGEACAEPVLPAGDHLVLAIPFLRRPSSGARGPRDRATSHAAASAVRVAA